MLLEKKEAERLAAELNQSYLGKANTVTNVVATPA
jgi:hypothetical protein